MSPRRLNSKCHVYGSEWKAIAKRSCSHIRFKDGSHCFLCPPLFWKDRCLAHLVQWSSNERKAREMVGPHFSNSYNRSRCFRAWSPWTRWLGTFMSEFCKSPTDWQDEQCRLTNIVSVWRLWTIDRLCSSLNQILCRYEDSARGIVCVPVWMERLSKESSDYLLQSWINHNPRTIRTSPRVLPSYFILCALRLGWEIWKRCRYPFWG